MAATGLSDALVAVQRFVDDHSAEFIMSLHTAAAQLRDNDRLSRRILDETGQLIESSNFCEELAAHMTDSCPDRLAHMFSRDVQVRRLSKHNQLKADGSLADEAAVLHVVPVLQPINSHRLHLTGHLLSMASPIDYAPQRGFYLLSGMPEFLQ